MTRKLKIQNIEIILIARRRSASSLRTIMMMALKVKEILSFKAIGVASFVAGKLHKVLLQRGRLTAAAARLVSGPVIDVVVVVTAADERRRRCSVLLVDQLELLVQVNQLLTAEATLADGVELYFAERRRR